MTTELKANLAILSLIIEFVGVIIYIFRTDY